MPNVVYEEEYIHGGSCKFWMWNMLRENGRIADIIRSWLGHKNSFDHQPFRGCAIVANDGCLYVIGRLCRTSSTKCKWRYDPIQNAWSDVSAMSTGWVCCRTGIFNNKLYVVGGFSLGQGGSIILQSTGILDPFTVTCMVRNTKYTELQR